MRIAKLKLIAAASAAAVGLAGTGALVAVSQEKKGTAGQPAEAAKADPNQPGKLDAAWNGDGPPPSAFPDIEPGAVKLPLPDGKTRVGILDTDPPVVKLRKAKLNLALRGYERAREKLQGVWGAPLDLAQLAVPVINAATELYPPADLLPWRRWFLSEMKQLERYMRAAGGRFAAAEVAAATTIRLDAEIALADLPPAAPPRATSEAKARLDALTEAVKLSKEVVETGNHRVEMLFNLLQLERDKAAAAAEVYGQTTELLPWYERWVEGAAWLEKTIRERFEAGTIGRQVWLQAKAQHHLAVGELNQLKRRLGK